MSSKNETLITAGKSALHYWKEIFRSKELFWILAKRDVMVRYKQTVLGVAWSVLRPLMTALVMVFAFGKIAKLETDTSIPYMLIVMPGVIIWLFFSQSLQQISSSILINANLVSKVYFPRLIIPFSSFLVGLLDAVIAFILFFLLCIWYQFVPSWHIIFAPLFLFLAYFAAFGLGLISAVLNVKYRDIAQIIPFAIQFGYFVSPVAYSSDLVVNKPWYKFFILNPVTGAIDAMRWCLLGENAAFNWDSFIPCVIFVVVSCFIAIKLFRKNENSFVDYI